MMDHMLQYDWNNSRQDDYFLLEEAVDDSAIEKIISNRFHDPLISSEEEGAPNRRINPSKDRVYVPGMNPVAPYPRLSVLTGVQHFQCLKVLCSRGNDDDQNFPSPSPFDIQAYETLKEVYQNEQKEFIEWAKTMWENRHCIRAIRPKPIVEGVYEAEFSVRAQRLSGYPKYFDMAAQIPLECTRRHKYMFRVLNTLIDVKMTDIPSITLPELTKNVDIINPIALPEPCNKHPYQFILPNDRSVSMLPIMEIHKELANYAAENDTKYIASENALKCLTSFNKHWTIPVTVCAAFTPSGEKINVVVLDSEFYVRKEPSMMRARRAFSHLLEHALIQPGEIEKRIEMYKQGKMNKPSTEEPPSIENLELSDDDEPLSLIILEDDDDDTNESYLSDEATEQKNNKKKKSKRHFEGIGSSSKEKKTVGGPKISVDDINNIIGVYNCTCTDTPYEVPPQRSFKLCQFMKKDKEQKLIVHYPHKARLNSEEVVLEPIPEYQLDLGARELPPDRVRNLALSLMLRENSSALKVRFDGLMGEMVMYEKVSAEEFLKEHEDKYEQVVNVIHTVLEELEGLLPGQYVLQHAPNHNANALLLVARPDGDKLKLNFDNSQLLDTDEAKLVKVPPTLTPVLMPFHKHRKILPCAFTPFEYQVTKEQRKPPAKQKVPPQAIKNNGEPQASGSKWPKKNRKNKKKKH